MHKSTLLFVLASSALMAALSAYILAREVTNPSPVPSRAAAAPTHSEHHHATGTLVAVSSFSNQTAADPDALARAHAAYPAELPPVQEGSVARAHLTVRDVVKDIAPGVHHAGWAFDGSIPGPILHVRQGQTVVVTLTNDGTIAHSIDFHAAQIAPDVAFRDLAPGRSETYRFRADNPGVFMYHCFSAPIMMHIANGMFGAIVVDPARPLPHADRQYVLLASEWYLDRPGLRSPAQFSYEKAEAMRPDWVTFNGYANQYTAHPLAADPGDTVRFYLVAAGPTFDVDFHVVGSVLERVWVDSDLSEYERGVQTVLVPAGGAAVMDVKIDEPGYYPFLSHAFGRSSLGEVGVLRVGRPRGPIPTH